MRKLLVIFICGLSTSISAQILNCNVIVNSERVLGTERGVFQDMEQAFTEFLNNRKWIDEEYLGQERINCNIFITIQSNPNVNNFTADVQIQAARPIYGTSYESVSLNFADRDWQFQYTEAQPLRFTENVFTSNITSLLAYYAYVILGFDYDTFEKLGGTPYFQIAQDIVNQAQASNAPGWQSFETPQRNRFWLVENLTNAQFTSFRESLYSYHREAMDVFLDDPDEARKKIIEVLEKAQEARRQRPNAILIISFLNAKSQELINVFSEGDMTLRKKAYEILSQIDPSKTDQYKAIIES